MNLLCVYIFPTVRGNFLAVGDHHGQTMPQLGHRETFPHRKNTPFEPPSALNWPVKDRTPAV